MKKVLLPIAGVIVFIILIGLLQAKFAGSFYNPLQKSPSPVPERKEILIAENRVTVEIADNDEERRKGLSKRDSLGEGTGMLFVFEENERPTFWMKNMNFAIDIIWVNDEKIVGIEKNIKPEPGLSEEKLTLYPAPQEIDHVIEVNAGYSQDHSLKVGDSVDLSNIN
jgi:uncharacterized membrane protein (UPF0127 family)